MSKKNQCPSAFGSGGRVMTLSFCTKEEGHEGDHRGYRKQWNQQGEKVKITEKEPSR